MQRRARQPLERPFPGEGDETEDEVDDLKGGKGLDGAVEVLCEKVPEDLGPEEAFDGGSYLI